MGRSGAAAAPPLLPDRLSSGRGEQSPPLWLLGGSSGELSHCRRGRRASKANPCSPCPDVSSLLLVFFVWFCLADTHSGSPRCSPALKPSPLIFLSKREWSALSQSLPQLTEHAIRVAVEIMLPYVRCMEDAKEIDWRRSSVFAVFGLCYQGAFQ